MSTAYRKQLTILLTGGGGPAIPGMIDVLRNNFDCKIIAVDMDPMAVGFYLADIGIVVPPGNNPQFFPTVRNICREYQVDVFISVVDEELVSCLALEKDGVKVIQPEKDFIELCLDKFLLTQKLRECGLNAPITCLASELNVQEIKFPLIFKPRTGRGSRGLHQIGSALELELVLAKYKDQVSQYIIQEFIDSTEFTVSVVLWRDGEVQAVVPKEIISKRGVTRLAISRKNSKIDELCRNVQKHLKANGPFNVQLRLKAETGDPYIFEINPRFSTSISLTIASGIDELTGLIKQALYGRSAHNFGGWRENTTLIRRTFDIFQNDKHPTILFRNS